MVGVNSPPWGAKNYQHLAVVNETFQILKDINSLPFAAAKEFLGSSKDL
jgi:hypothetical protein